LISFTTIIAAETQSGIGAFNINLKSFIFQLVTFVLVLWILRKWAFPKIIETIEARRETLEKSLVQAKQTQEALARAEVRADEIIAKGRVRSYRQGRDRCRPARSLDN
jgi:F-type H+-transporting ATPase subunit b